MRSAMSQAIAGFQSTLPVRGATMGRNMMQAMVNISIHAPREGSDMSAVPCLHSLMAFQSTLPVRGATVYDT